MAAMLSMALYNLMDTLWLARTSHQAVAALTVNFPIQMILAALGVGTGVGAGSFAARMFGAGDWMRPEDGGPGFLLTVAFGTLLIVLTLADPDGLLRLFGASGDILPMARSYLTIVIFSSPCVLFFMMVNNLLRAEGRPNLSMHVVLAFSAVGMVLDPLFILGWGPIPAMGIRGAAYSAVISQSVAALLSLYFISLRSSKYRLDRSLLLPNPAILRSIFQTGFPSIIMNFVVSAVIVVYNHALVPFGDEALATLGMCLGERSVDDAPLRRWPRRDAHGRLQRRRPQLCTFDRNGAGGHPVFPRPGGGVFSVARNPGPQILGLFWTDPHLTAMAVRRSDFRFRHGHHRPALVGINMFSGLGKGSTAMWLMFGRDMLLLVPLLILLPPFLGVSGVWMAQPLSSVVAFFIIRRRALREINSFREAAAV
jgi:Na+-driven multidrug efflux pump